MSRVENSDFCVLCRKRAPELVCGCQTPWPRLCKHCSAEHLSKGGDSFHSVLPIKYLANIKTLQDFKRFYAREVETSEVLQWLDSNLQSIQEAEDKLDQFANASIDELTKWKESWLRELHKVREQLSRDISDIRSRVELEYVSGSEVEKLQQLKERTPALLSFHVPDLSLSHALDAATSLALFSPGLLREVGPAASSAADATLHSDAVHSLKATVTLCKEFVQFLTPQNPIVDLDIETSSVTSWTKQAHWATSQLTTRACSVLGEIDRVCNLMLGAQAQAFAGQRIEDKLKAVHTAVSVGVSASRELSRSLRAKAREEQLSQALAAKTHECDELMQRKGELERELHLHTGCQDLRTTINTLNARVQLAEEGKAQAELRLRDNLEQYCRAVITQHREKLAAVRLLVRSELAKKEQLETHLLTDSKDVEQQVASAMSSLTEAAKSNEDLKSATAKATQGQGLLKSVASSLPVHEHDHEEWTAVTQEWKGAVDKLRRDSASKTAIFLSNVLEEVFTLLRKLMQESDEQLMRSIGMVTGLIDSPNLRGVMSWVEKCKPLIPKKKLSDYETIGVCYSAFLEELNKVIGAFSSQFGGGIPKLDSLKKHCFDTFSPLTPGLLSEPLKTAAQSSQALLTRVSARSADIVQAAIQPVQHALSKVVASVGSFLPQLSTAISSTESQLKVLLSESNSRLGSALRSSTAYMVNAVEAEISREVPDFPPALSIVPLPEQIQTKMIEDLQGNLQRKSDDFDQLTTAHYDTRLQFFSQSIEQRWTQELRCALSVWTARSLVPHKKKSLCEKSLPRLRLPYITPFLVVPDIVAEQPESDSGAMTSLQCFQFFDYVVGVLYEESRRARREGRAIDSYVTLIRTHSQFAADLPKALPGLWRLYSYEQPQAVMLAKLFGLFDQQPLSGESCFVVSHHRQAFKALAFFAADRAADLSSQYHLSVCWEVPLPTLLREYLLSIVHGRESLRIWSVWLAHLKPERVSLSEFGWSVLDWILRHFVAAGAISIWQAASSTGEVTTQSLQTAIYEGADRLIPEPIVQEMVPDILSKSEFERLVAAERAESTLLVRGDMFLCGVVEAIQVMEEVDRAIRASYQGVKKPAGYSHPLLTSQLAL